MKQSKLNGRDDWSKNAWTAHALMLEDQLDEAKDLLQAWLFAYYCDIGKEHLAEEEIKKAFKRITEAHSDQRY